MNSRQIKAAHTKPASFSLVRAPLNLMCVLCALLAALMSSCSQKASSAVDSKVNQDNKVTLLFSMDQGFENGVLSTGDVEGVKRMVKALEPLREKYNVCVLLNPQIKDKNRLKLVLDTLVAQKMPFALDVISSDTFALGQNCAANAPYDATHGLGISVEQLAAYKKEYGPWLVGLRFMEVFGQDFSVRTMKAGDTGWQRKGDKFPADDFFSPALAEGYIRFAKENDMFVQWADFQWGEFAPWDKLQPRTEERVVELLRKYPGVVTVTYNNNSPDERSLKHLDIWHTAVERFPKEGAAGYGLSNQSWLRNFHYMDTTPEEMIHWSKSALDKGCRLIQFEPAWYYFNLPLATFKSHEEFSDNYDYTKDPKWATSGEAREPLKKMISFLLAPETAGPRPAFLPSPVTKSP